MKVICTGISGSGKLDYLKQAVDEAGRLGEEIHLYNVGDLMFKKDVYKRQVEHALGQPL